MKKENYFIIIGVGILILEEKQMRVFRNVCLVVMSILLVLYTPIYNVVIEYDSLNFVIWPYFVLVIFYVILEALSIFLYNKSNLDKKWKILIMAILALGSIYIFYRYIMKVEIYACCFLVYIILDLISDAFGEKQ